MRRGRDLLIDAHHESAHESVLPVVSERQGVFRDEPCYTDASEHGRQG
jgi:hypothetical protein